MKAFIIIHSYHHGNTEKVAYAMAAKLSAEVQDTQNMNTEDLRKYDLIGFGAGIDSGKHYAPILNFAKTLPIAKGQKVFIFSTSAIYGKKKMFRDHMELRNILTAKGYTVLDEFSCLGFNTNSVLKYLGGLNKGRPNTKDLKSAVDFADRLAQCTMF